MKPIIELFEYKNGDWGYRFKSGQNHNLLVGSTEGYHSKGNAKRELNRFLESIKELLLSDIDINESIKEIPYDDKLNS